MSAPTPILGVTGGPPKSPGRLPNRIEAGGSGGGGGGGLTPHPIRAGVNIAFGSSASDEAPLWQLLDELGPT